jgi:hypothetical protein
MGSSTVSNGFVFPAKACFQAYLEQSAFDLARWSARQTFFDMPSLLERLLTCSPATGRCDIERCCLSSGRLGKTGCVNCSYRSNYSTASLTEPSTTNLTNTHSLVTLEVVGVGGSSGGEARQREDKEGGSGSSGWHSSSSGPKDAALTGY